MRFSVVIATYNYSVYLPRALESVLSQPGDDYELIVVDDGSTDGTAEVVRDYQGRFPDKLTYIYQEHRCIGAARNRGIAEAKGRFVIFLDADDALIAGVFDKLRLSLNEYGDCDFLLGGRVVVNAKGKQRVYPARELVRDKQDNLKAFLRDHFTTACTGNLAVHRRVFDSLRYPESVRLWQDIVFHSHLFARFTGKNVPYPLVLIYRHPDSLSHDLALVRDDGPRIVPLVFDAPGFPSELACLRNQFVARIQLSLFQMSYSRGLFEDAQQAFRRAFESSPAQVLNAKFLRRYLKVAFYSRTTK